MITFFSMLNCSPWLLFPLPGEKEIGKERVRHFVKLHLLNLDCCSRLAEYILREAGWEEDECGFKIEKETSITCCMFVKLLCYPKMQMIWKP